jgi:aspartyl-tRNA(Asn)/glutamyl-tRNA(Gln) amidotransferase subunit C
MAHVFDADTAYRPDRAEQRITHEEALSNAPDADGDYFRVPKVIE